MRTEMHLNDGPASMKRIGQGHGPSYDVANLASLFTVCAVALDGSNEWSDAVADRIRADIKHVLEWGSLLAEGMVIEIEKLETRGQA